jgi:magnesium and cobalt transporter
MPNKVNKKAKKSEPREQKTFWLTAFLSSFLNRFKSQKTNNFPARDVSTIFSNFDNLATRTVEDVMIPRSDIIAVKSDVTIEDLSAAIVEHGHTRTLVYKGSLDNVIGFVHIKDLFEIIAESKTYNLKKLIRPHLVSPYSMKLIDLFTQMQVKRTHIAIVVDEYGGTDGIVTIEDIIEKIVGRKIDDEHDDDEPVESYKVLKSGVIISSARVEVEEIEKILSVRMKYVDDEFDTIGGLVMARSGHVPEKGDIIQITEEVSIEILDATPRSVKHLKITCKTPV